MQAASAHAESQQLREQNRQLSSVRFEHEKALQEAKVSQEIPDDWNVMVNVASGLALHSGVQQLAVHAPWASWQVRIAVLEQQVADKEELGTQRMVCMTSRYSAWCT